MIFLGPQGSLNSSTLRFPSTINDRGFRFFGQHDNLIYSTLRLSSTRNDRVFGIVGAAGHFEFQCDEVPQYEKRYPKISSNLQVLTSDTPKWSQRYPNDAFRGSAGYEPNSPRLVSPTSGRRRQSSVPGDSPIRSTIGVLIF